MENSTKENLTLVSNQLEFDNKGMFLTGKNESGEEKKVYIEDFKKLPYQWDKKELAFIARQKTSIDFTWIILGATTLTIWFLIIGSIIYFG